MVEYRFPFPNQQHQPNKQQRHATFGNPNGFGNYHLFLFSIGLSEWWSPALAYTVIPLG